MNMDSKAPDPWLQPAFQPGKSTAGPQETGCAILSSMFFIL